MDLSPNFPNLALKPFSKAWLGACVAKFIIFYRAAENQKFWHKLWTKAPAFPISLGSCSVKLDLEHCSLREWNQD